MMYTLILVSFRPVIELCNIYVMLFELVIEKNEFLIYFKEIALPSFQGSSVNNSELTSLSD